MSIIECYCPHTELKGTLYFVYTKCTFKKEAYKLLICHFNKHFSLIKITSSLSQTCKNSYFYKFQMYAIWLLEIALVFISPEDANGNFMKSQVILLSPGVIKRYPTIFKVFSKFIDYEIKCKNGLSEEKERLPPYYGKKVLNQRRFALFPFLKKVLIPLSYLFIRSFFCQYCKCLTKNKFTILFRTNNVDFSISYISSLIISWNFYSLYTVHITSFYTMVPQLKNGIILYQNRKIMLKLFLYSN